MTEPARNLPIPGLPGGSPTHKLETATDEVSLALKNANTEHLQARSMLNRKIEAVTLLGNKVPDVEAEGDFVKETIEYKEDNWANARLAVIGIAGVISTILGFLIVFSAAAAAHPLVLALGIALIVIGLLTIVAAGSRIRLTTPYRGAVARVEQAKDRVELAKKEVVNAKKEVAKAEKQLKKAKDAYTIAHPGTAVEKELLELNKYHPLFKEERKKLQPPQP